MPYDASRHGPHRIVGPGFHERVWALVRAVPRGCVTTYGDLAQALGSKNVARHVGFAMAALPNSSDVPWWRVVAAGGRLATANVATQRRQAKALAAEGIAVAKGRVRDLAAHRLPLPG
jgi:methylated-DNA-protein-cysteine methyltransferase-like protein